ncbi:DUF3037 domain-containing protein [Bacteroides ihuae]|uniref:DUF3037 domain-containing protein n=1 Tax=Bacteroides ihuae TaxID=1852362 RepID=UPI0008DA5467|nr:DUF3037 domain-containing protein [Bacteroides ihuae]
MNRQLLYSILQYKHSALLKEAVNVGVLFYFPDEIEKLHFHFSTPERVKAIYPDFDSRYFNALLRVIESNVEKYSTDLMADKLLQNDFEGFINSYILKYDDSALQFTSIYSAVNVWSNIQQVLANYTSLLLPLTQSAESKLIRHDDNFVIKKFKTCFISNNKKELFERINSPQIVRAEDFELKFDLSWQNGTLNLIKPLSLDLLDEQSIQRKTAQYCGYLGWMGRYLSAHNSRVDFLLSEPQDSSLHNTFERSISLLQRADANKKIVRLQEIEAYAEKVENALLAN